jgi:predicted transcriptional regulator|nr:helix-turn-helix domain-containing protein [uncultured Ruminococcus sp.]
MTNFFMIPNEVFDLQLKPVQFAVLCYIMRCCDKSNTCYPSMRKIAESCSISETTARKSIYELCERNIISKAGGFSMGKFGKIQSAPYVYSVNPDFFDEGFGRENLIASFA